jgi:hypothetical protein
VWVEVYGVLVPAEDSHATAALDRLMKDEQLRRAMGLRVLEDRRSELAEMFRSGRACSNNVWYFQSTAH